MMRRALLSLALLLFVSPAWALSDAPYVNADVDLISLLPPPPAMGSAAERADLAAVLAAQKARTPAQAAKAEADSTVTVFQFAEVLGPSFTKEKLPKVDAFFTKVFQDANVPGTVVKNFWARPRPYDAFPASVKPPGNMIKSTRSLKDGTPTFSYPGGHAAWSVEYAILLSEMVPEKRGEIFARAWEIGNQRIVGGVHYPTDIEAGRISGAVLTALMMQNPAFRADMAEIKTELRTALNLAP